MQAGLFPLRWMESAVQNLYYSIEHKKRQEFLSLLPFFIFMTAMAPGAATLIPTAGMAFAMLKYLDQDLNCFGVYIKIIVILCPSASFNTCKWCDTTGHDKWVCVAIVPHTFTIFDVHQRQHQVLTVFVPQRQQNLLALFEFLRQFSNFFSYAFILCRSFCLQLYLIIS